MHCDIHAFTERKEGGHWVCDQTFDIYYEDDVLIDWDIRGELPASHRNYYLFGLLSVECGRGYGGDDDIAFKTDCTLPDDISPELHTFHHEVWEPDSHSHNTITYVDARKKLVELLLRTDKTEAANTLHEFFQTMPGFDDQETERRLVIWFDN